MKRKKKIALVIGIAVFVPLALMVYHAYRQSALNGRRLQVLTHPDSVEVYRLTNYTKWDSLDRNALTQPGRAPSGDDLKQLIAVLTPYVKDPDYSNGRDNNKCDPIPGVAFRFRKNADQLDVLVCYQCYTLNVLLPHSIPRNFDDQHVTMVKIARHSFPDDKEIQELRDD